MYLCVFLYICFSKMVIVDLLMICWLQMTRKCYDNKQSTERRNNKKQNYFPNTTQDVW